MGRLRTGYLRTGGDQRKGEDQVCTHDWVHMINGRVSKKEKKERETGKIMARMNDKRAGCPYRGNKTTKRQDEQEEEASSFLYRMNNIVRRSVVGMQNTV